MTAPARFVLLLVLTATLATFWKVGCRLLAVETAYRQPDIAGLEVAIGWDAANADLHARLGRRYGDIPGRVEAAIQHTERAAELAPYDWRAHAQLSQLYEISGHRDQAESALLRAIDLSPNYPAYQWRLANFYLRNGREDDFWEPARKALAADSLFLHSAFSLMIKMNGSADRIDRAWPSDREANLKLVSLLYFLGPELLEERYLPLLLDRWRALLADDPPPTLDEASAFFQALLRLQRFDQARRHWIALAEVNSLDERQFAAGENLLWNGSFERPLSGVGLGWHSSEAEGVRVETMISQGRTALAIAFDGSRNLSDTVLSQRVVVRPGTTYRFSYDVRTEGLTTDRGPHFEFQDPIQRISVHSTAELFGSAPWQPRLSTFAVGPDTSMLVIRLRRHPSSGIDGRIAGTLWVDRLVLTSTAGDHDRL